MFLRYVSIVLFLVGMFPITIFAQATESFSVAANPEFPREFSRVTISIESFSTDLDRAKVTWRENNVIVAQDVGIKERVFTAPQNGSTKVISIEVITQNNFKIVKQYVLAPQAIDLLWEATDSYVPPFYRGKALAGEQSIIRVVAIPNFTQKGSLLDRNQAVYTWTRNTTEPEGSSGYGKSSFTFRLNPLKSSEKISVLAGNVSGEFQVRESLLLQPSPTKVILYEASPLLGTIFGQAFTTGLRLVSDEIVLVAEPYYFSGLQDIRSKVSFSWSLDGASVRTGTDPMRLTLRRPSTAGQTDVGISVSHTEKTLQTAKSVIQIVYDSK